MEQVEDLRNMDFYPPMIISTGEQTAGKKNRKRKSQPQKVDTIENVNQIISLETGLEMEVPKKRKGRKKKAAAIHEQELVDALGGFI